MIRRYDTVNARKLQYVAQFAPSIEECQPYVKALRRYLTKAQINPLTGMATIPVDYEAKHDRLFAVDSLAIQPMSRRLRNYLVPDGTLDIDIVNSAPSVISQLCRKHDIATPCLDAFLPNYKERLAEISNDYGKTKALIFFSANQLANEDCPGWLRALKVELKDVVYEGLRQHYGDIHVVAERSDREKREDSTKRQRRGGSTYSENVPGIFLSYLYFHYESRILDAIEDAGILNGYWDDHLSLMFDGLMVVKRPGVDINLGVLEDAVERRIGIRIQLAFKPTTTTMELDITKMPDKLVVMDGDDEASNIVVLALEGQVLRCDDCIFVKHDGVWTDNVSLVDDFLLRKVCDMDIKAMVETKDGFKETNYSVDVKNARNIVRLARTKFPSRPNFVRDLVLGSQFKLAFQNGYWQFTEDPNAETGIYGRFVRGGSFDTGVRIETMFPMRVQEDIDFVMAHMIDPPLDNTMAGTKDLFLLSLARALAGHMDKVTNIWVGGRDSSKSCIMQFVRNALGKYAGNIPSGVFAIRGGSMNDAYRDGAWIFDVEMARVGAISESTQNSTTETIFSGDTLKKFQSCKEGMQARKIRQNQREAYSLVTGFMLLNDIPRFEPADAIEKCHIYAFPNRFVSKEDKDNNPFKETYKVANPNVEDWVKEPKYHAALLWILFEAYRPELVKPNQDMIESADQLMDETGLAMYDRLLDITLDFNDTVPQSEVLKVLKTSCPGIGHSRILRELQGIVDDRCREMGLASFPVKCRMGSGHSSNRRNGYRGVKIINEQSQGFGNGYSNGFMP